MEKTAVLNTIRTIFEKSNIIGLDADEVVGNDGDLAEETLLFTKGDILYCERCEALSVSFPLCRLSDIVSIAYQTFDEDPELELRLYLRANDRIFFHYVDFEYETSVDVNVYHAAGERWIHGGSALFYLSDVVSGLMDDPKARIIEGLCETVLSRPNTSCPEVVETLELALRDRIEAGQPRACVQYLMLATHLRSADIRAAFDATYAFGKLIELGAEARYHAALNDNLLYVGEEELAFQSFQCLLACELDDVPAAEIAAQILEKVQQKEAQREAELRKVQLAHDIPF